MLHNMISLCPPLIPEMKKHVERGEVPIASVFRLSPRIYHYPPAANKKAEKAPDMNTVNTHAVKVLANSFQLVPRVMLSHIPTPISAPNYKN